MSDAPHPSFERPADLAAGMLGALERSRLVGQHAAARTSLSRLLEFTFQRLQPGQNRLELQLLPRALLQVESFQLGL